MKRRIYDFFLCLCFCAALPVPLALATLGESVDSVAADQKALSGGKKSILSGNGYTIHQFETGGSCVREYVSPSGIVFGIAWNGPAYPDLKPLLGSYAADYQKALRETPRNRGRRHQSIVKTDRVVVEKWGTMRDLQGRAYAPALIPPGVTIDEIK